MTYTSFVADLAALVVTGVRKRFDAPPSQLSTSVLPAQYVRLPEGNSEVVSFTGATGLFSVVCELVIVVNAMAQDSATPNFELTLTLMDALDTALRTEALADSNIDKWSFTPMVDAVGNTPYWMIVARVEASE